MNPKEQELIKALKKFYGRKKNAMHKVALEMWSNNDISDEGYHQLFPENKPDGSRAKTVGSRPTCDDPGRYDTSKSKEDEDNEDEDEDGEIHGMFGPETPQSHHWNTDDDGCGHNFNQGC